MKSTRNNARTTLLLAAPLLPALLSGCLRARVDESREMATAIAKTESVVVLAKPQIEGAGAEAEFVDCVGQRIGGRDHAIAVHPNEAFTDKLFPWFEPGTVPTRPEQIATVLAQPGVSEQVAATGVRYVVWLDGGTHKTDGGGSLACGVAPGAAGCIGFGWWEKESAYEATVWDLKQSKSVGSVGTTVSGTSAVVGAIVPLPFIARVEGTACMRLGDQLRGFLAGSSQGGR
jgi:hypothetical protein